MSRVRSLDVHLGDELVAEVHTPRSGKMTLSYRPEVVERVGDGALVLSATLPARAERFSPSEAAPFLEGLLPDGRARTGLERRFDVHRVDSFSLLAAVGRECAGAVSLVPQGEAWPPPPGEPARLDEATIAGRLAGLERDPLGVDDDTRITLAGTPWKLPLSRLPDGGWAAPRAGRWSSHLLRPEAPDRRGSVVSEAHALEVLRRSGLPVVEAEATSFDRTPALVVSRYDRRVEADGSVVRIHQEDCCQALGASRAERSEQTGGPTRAEIAGLLRELSADPEADLAQLLAWVVACLVFGKDDGTARDLCLLYPGRGATIDSCRLAPIASMSVSGSELWLDRSEVLAEAETWGFPRVEATSIVDDLLDRIDESLDGARDHADPGDSAVGAARSRTMELSAPG